MSRASEFARAVIVERARLAIEDPVGEVDAVAPLTYDQAMRILRRAATRRDPPRRGAQAVGSRATDSDLLERMGADPTRTHGVIRCPAHEDRSPSLSWKVEGDKVLLHCHAGCTFADILGAVR